MVQHYASGTVFTSDRGQATVFLISRAEIRGKVDGIKGTDPLICRITAVDSNSGGGGDSGSGGGMLRPLGPLVLGSFYLWRRRKIKTVRLD